MRNKLQRLSGWPSSVIRGLSLGLVTLIGLIDYLTGVDVSVTLFYLVPISLGTWFAGRSTGLALAAASTLVWLAADLYHRTRVGPPLVPIWNSVMEGMIFVVVAFLLGALKDRNSQLERQVQQRTQLLREEIAERVRTERELKATNAELTAARAELHAAFVKLQAAYAELQRTQTPSPESTAAPAESRSSPASGN